MGVGYFKCLGSCIESIYSLFDNLCNSNKEMALSIAEGKDVYMRKSYHGDVYVNTGTRKVVLPIDTFSNLDRKVYIESKGVVELDNLNSIDFSIAYFYDSKDVARVSKGGIHGRYNSHVSNDIVYKPISMYSFEDVCEVRGNYLDYADNRYRKLEIGDKVLPLFKERINSNKSYKELFKSYIDKGYCVNRLFENRGSILCRNSKVGYSYIENLTGVESDFYNELLEFVVGLGVQVNSVFFYSDLDWSKILIRESRKVKGEYEILIK